MALDSVPDVQLTDAQKLNPDGIVQLYDLTLTTDTVMYLTMFEEVTWQGNTYGSIALQISSNEIASSGKQSRPKLNIANPAGTYSSVISAGAFDNATIVEHRVRKTDLDADNDVSVDRKWAISHYDQLTHFLATFELRTTVDRQRMRMPHRTYSPPTFKSVSIS